MTDNDTRSLYGRLSRVGALPCATCRNRRPIIILQGFCATGRPPHLPGRAEAKTLATNLYWCVCIFSFVVAFFWPFCFTIAPMGKSCLLTKSPLTVGGVTSFQRYEYLRIIQRKAKGHDGREWVMVTTASVHTQQQKKNITGKTTQVRRATLRARKKTHTPLAAFMHPSGP